MVWLYIALTVIAFFGLAFAFAAKLNTQYSEVVDAYNKSGTPDRRPLERLRKSKNALIVVMFISATVVSYSLGTVIYNSY